VQPARKPARVQSWIEGDANEELEHLRSRPAKKPLPRAPRPATVSVPAADIFEGTDRFTPKTTFVHGGEVQNFPSVDDLISFFESPDRKQENWVNDITTSTDERNQIEQVNVTVNDAWIYEISKQKDNDYHLLIGVSPDQDGGRYLNAEISGIDPQGPDAPDLWALRQLFKSQFPQYVGRSLPSVGRFIQPTNPIHIRITGSIFLDADHGRNIVGHGNIKNFTSWEIHPITKIEFVDE
jgi:hypothetical protein